MDGSQVKSDNVQLDKKDQDSAKASHTKGSYLPNLHHNNLELGIHSTSPLSCSGIPSVIDQEREKLRLLKSFKPHSSILIGVVTTNQSPQECTRKASHGVELPHEPIHSLPRNSLVINSPASSINPPPRNDPGGRTCGIWQSHADRAKKGTRFDAGRSEFLYDDEIARHLGAHLVVLGPERETQKGLVHQGTVYLNVRHLRLASKSGISGQDDPSDNASCCARPTKSREQCLWDTLQETFGNGDNTKSWKVRQQIMDFQSHDPTDFTV